MTNQSTALLSIDQGTTSSRAIVFDPSGAILSLAQQEFRQIYPADGWVEHDAEEIWSSTLAVCREALTKTNVPVAAAGITNQRETTVVWDRATGETVYNAIVWQDRRTAATCAELKAQGLEPTVTEKTGLLLDPYFSGTKLAWILDNVPDARERADRGELAFGTIDSFLLWRLTEGRCHATDATNASRTLLFNIHTQSWDPELLQMFQVPESVLPEVKDSSDDFGATAAGILPHPIPITGIAGDQHAALVGQACFEPGMVKSTYGTGCFAMLNTGVNPVASGNRLLTTMAYRLDGTPTYALEGSIFIAGAAVQWLRDGLGVIQSAAETEALAAQPGSSQGVYLVPAFTGLGAPYWDPHARGALLGLTRDTGPQDLARAALESVCYQTHDLIDAMHNDGASLASLRVDGGMVANDWMLQRLADTTGVAVERPVVIETTALGAAYLAGLHCGVFGSLGDLSEKWGMEAEFNPRTDAKDRAESLRRWHLAVDCARSFGS